MKEKMSYQRTYCMQIKERRVVVVVEKGNDELKFSQYTAITSARVEKEEEQEEEDQ
tara:strand:- start:100 stop:267 length:168 start_codon:yes stop_codon:yes gene_type:complete